MKIKQKGLTTVEFAIIGALFFIVLFGVIEFGRMLFAWNTLTESTRRGARVATVCPVNHAAIARIAVFNNPNTSGASPVLVGLDTSHVVIQYLEQDGTTIGSPTANFGDIRYVRVRINGYEHNLFIPFFNKLLTDSDIPDFETTLPVESLGAVPNPDDPDAGETQCFGF